MITQKTEGTGKRLFARTVDRISDSIKRAIQKTRKASLVFAATATIYGCSAENPLGVQKDASVNADAPVVSDRLISQDRLVSQDRQAIDAQVIDAGVSDRSIIDGSFNDGLVTDSSIADAMPDALVCRPYTTPTPVTCTNGSVTTISTLIGETLDSRLLDRQSNTGTYSWSTPEPMLTSHPFADGIGGILEQTQTDMYLLTGNALVAGARVVPEFNTWNVLDTSAGIVYSEIQRLFVRAESQYREAADTIQTRNRNLIYQLKFYSNVPPNPFAEAFGIPVCTTPTNGNWANCASDIKSENHSLRVRIGNNDWFITNMQPPIVTFTNAQEVVRGGQVDLGRIAASSVINQGDILSYNRYRYGVRLDDVTPDGRAIVSVVDECGRVLIPAVTITNNVTTIGNLIKVKLNEVSPQNQFPAKWANLSIITDELEFIDNGTNTSGLNNNFVRYNGIVDSQSNIGAVLAWTNRGFNSGNQTADHLRSITFFQDGSTDFISTGQSLFSSLVVPDLMSFSYNGLNLNPNNSVDYNTMGISANDGSFQYTLDGSNTPSIANVTSYVDIRQNQQNFFVSAQGTGNQIRLGFDNAVPRGMNPDADQVMLRLANGKYVILGSIAQARNRLTVSTPSIGTSGNISAGGAITFAYADSAVSSIGRGNIDFSVSSQPTSRYVSVIASEDAGVSISAQRPGALAFVYDKTLRSLDQNIGQYSRGRVLYSTTTAFSPVPNATSTEGNLTTTREVNFITERGSIVISKNDSQIDLKLANTPASVQYSFTIRDCR
ncbi:MAG: hypothetical protein AABX38_06755 [Candidatus Micrarchaeota archaeon]|mgnify:CR=1 FL=1